MTDFIKMLSKPVRKQKQSSSANTLDSDDTDESDCDTDVANLTYDPKYGMNAIVSVLIPKIYASFFSSERYDDSLKKDLMPKVVEQMVLITSLLSQYEKEKLIVPIILESVKDEEDEERRFYGVVLIDELAETLGL